MIAIDSQVLIWAIKRTASENRVHMIPRAVALVAELERTRERIMIPSLVASEFLVRYEETERGSALAKLQTLFFVAPFDAKAAWLAAKMFADKASWDKSRVDDGYTRQWIKTDIAILATAMAHDASAMYIEDEPLFNLATNLKAYITMSVRRLPQPAPIELDEPAPPPRGSAGQRDLFFGDT